MIAKKSKGQRLLQIDNGHFANCGRPPSFDASDRYVGYFENAFGEQWVFIGDPQTGEAMLRGGDVGWETEHKISLKDPCPDQILNEPEKVWIVTCFMAMSGNSFDKVVTDYNRAAKRRVAALAKRLEEQGR